MIALSGIAKKVYKIISCRAYIYKNIIRIINNPKTNKPIAMPNKTEKYSTFSLEVYSREST